MEDVLSNYFKNASSNNRIGHAFLCANTRYELIKEKLELTIKEYLIKDLFYIEECPDIYIIEPETSVIKKEQIHNMQSEIIKTSQTNNMKIYIIKECDKLHPSAANSLLKMLEEPGNNVYSFLITENLEKVMPTIVSRCQLLYMNTISNKDYTEDEIAGTLENITNIEIKGMKTLAYNYKNYKKMTKEDLKKSLNIVEYFYRDCLNYINGLELEYFLDKEEIIGTVVNKNTSKSLIKKSLIINENINLLNYNVNINSFIDKILIELWRCNNE